MSPEPHDPQLVLERLHDPLYCEQQRQRYEREPLRWMWFLNYHVHGCKQCSRVWAHTGLEAKRDGDASHQCCGRDVREPVPPAPAAAP